MYEFLDRRYALAIYEIAQSKNAVDRYIEDLKDICPNLYNKASIKLKDNWDKTFSLLNKGMEEGSIKRVNIEVIKAMVNGFFEHMFKEGLLDTISYHEAITELSNIIINGIRK